MNLMNIVVKRKLLDLQIKSTGYRLIKVMRKYFE